VMVGLPWSQHVAFLDNRRLRHEIEHGIVQAVGELAAALPVSRPAVSQHLKVLKDAGLVAEHAEGTRRIYQLNEAGLSALRDQLDTFWKRALTGYQNIVEDSNKEKS